MDVDEMMKGARDALTVRRVFGEPIERGETTVVPVAKVMGTSGGGSGEGPADSGGGEGGGFAVRAKPAGVYVIQGGKVRWVPAVDPVRIVLALGVATAVLLGATARLSRARDARTAHVVRAVRLARTIARAKRRAGR